MKSRFSWQSFLIYLICSTIPLSILMVSHTLSQIREDQIEYDSVISKEADYVMARLDGAFSELENTANEIYLSSWFKKSISKAEVFQKEFTIVRRMEISSELRYKATVLDFAEDILILDANSDMLICKYGWFGDSEKYQSAYCQFDLTNLLALSQSSSYYEPIRSADSRYFIVSYDNPNLTDTRRIAILIRKDTVSRFLNHYRYNRFKEILFVPAAENADVLDLQVERVFSRTFSRPDGMVSFVYTPFEEARIEENTNRIILSLTLVLLSAIILAAIFTWVFARPLNKLLESIAPGATKGYRGAIEGIGTHISEINGQYEALQQRMGRFVDEMRSEILLRMMMGTHFSEVDSDSMSRLFPWLISGKPYFLVMVSSGYLLPELDGALGGLWLELPMDCRCCVYWQDSEALCVDKIKALRNEADFLCCSSVGKGVESLQACYEEVVEQLNLQHYDFADELALLTYLQEGDAQQCLKLISQYREKNSSAGCERFIKVLDQWLCSKGMHESDESCANSSDDWAVLEKRIVSYCAHEEPSSSTNELSLITSVNRFINEYYALPALSLKYLASQFDTTVGSLSRIYKQETGRNFSAVLLEIRMERAKELLRNTDQSIAGIALACGYENYLSFKRAFIRLEEISPREYRDIHREGMPKK